MLLRHNGVRPRQRARSKAKSEINLETLKNVFTVLEKEGSVNGFSKNQDAGELWMRSNLVNMVYRGNLEKEKISSLRPIHLESYRVRNASSTRDYYTADQVYLMLGADPKVKENLRSFLSEGWDDITNKINVQDELDVDSLGLLHIVKNIKPGFLDTNESIGKIKPILNKQALLYCEDVRRLLVYKRLIPRNVLIDYFKTLTSFHLSIYIQKLIYLVPKMVESGSIDVKDDWNIVIDTTDNFDSQISKTSISDSEKLFNSIYKYLESTFKINMALEYCDLERDDSKNLKKALQILKNPPDDFEIYFRMKYRELYSQLDDEDKYLVEDITRYDELYFDKYLSIILNVKAKRQFIEHKRLLANLSQNNNTRGGFMSQGRSKKHPRRFNLGTRLLETIVQILVLDIEDDNFVTRTLSVEELIDNIKSRYGLIINGLSDQRFKGSDLNTHLGFKENVESFKLKLRQIGFYNDLSDAYILQRIRPRYELND
ncbi:hypothetical protein JCM19274_2194 [Algibacter lectus]|uniref:Uncharacterized protein n=2 Tax=Algibacter lectus TaxID=221126 RepID=A0A090WV91_9FLAO|nr:hypothetical protein JCM19274_2194 [Algibacter lectus]